MALPVLFLLFSFCSSEGYIRGLVCTWLDTLMFPVLSPRVEDTLCVETVLLPQSFENSSQVSISLEPINIFRPQLLLMILLMVCPYTLSNWA